MYKLKAFLRRLNFWGLQTKNSQIQVNKLANFIMAEVDGEPSQSEGAVDTAIRIIRNNKENK